MAKSAPGGPLILIFQTVSEPMSSKIINFKQRDITDCGAASLASVAAFYGHKLPLSRIRQYASTDRSGTTVLGLMEAARKLGFIAKGVKGGFDSLYKIPKPAIAHVIVKDVLHHFVVIQAVDARWVTVMDPAYGEVRKLSHEELKPNGLASWCSWFQQTPSSPATRPPHP